MNVLPNVLSSSTLTGLYADDTKLYKAITASHEDCDHLQEALLSYAYGWSKQSNIDFNASKCKILTISHRKSPIEAKYHLGLTELMPVDSEVDLGVTVTRNLSWNQHIIEIGSKANRILGLLRRTCPLLTNRDARKRYTYHW